LMGWKTAENVRISRAITLSKVPLLWYGSVVLPNKPGAENRYRLFIREYEQYFTDPLAIPWNTEERLVYAEALELHPVSG
jgi:hypothetical protein